MHNSSTAPGVGTLELYSSNFGTSLFPAISKGVTKEDLCIEAQEGGKNFAIIIKSSLFEGIFTDAKGVNLASLEIVRAKKYFI